jgi:2-phospho-L-lactate guanylyltransferase
MSNIWAIIPVKPLANAKSRLAPVLAPAQRQQLSEQMFRHVLGVASQTPQLAGTLVISRDTKALAIARDYGVRTVQESGQPELNTALMRATSLIASWRGGGVLILPADLPLVTSQDLSAMIHMARDVYSLVIATDRDEDGTNAMLVRPPGMIAYAYGVGSYTRHIERAKAAGAKIHVCRSDRLMLDIDLPEDLEHLARLNGHAGESANSILKAAEYKTG